MDEETTPPETTEATPPHRRWLRRLLGAVGAGLAVGVLLVGLFVLNGTVLDRGGTPEVAVTEFPAATIATNGQHVRLLAYNIAKAFVHQGRLNFLDEKEVRDRLDKVAALIREQRADIVFLSEAIRDCGPCPVNQIEYLAKKTEMHSWAYGENYNVGLPFYRISGGNAILSRWPLDGVANPDLHGRKPFYVTKNNRRVLICSVEMGDSGLMLAALHNDSFNLENNAKQAREIVDLLSVQLAIAAGDFNASPGTDSMKVYQDSGRFNGEWHGPHTFPAHDPDRTIDFILAPSDWKLIEHEVIPNEASDHCAVLSVFEVKGM
ncbi:MAG: endonuclease/exonuclease/phosphatase family protein [Limisphaerales bacterium]